MHLMGRCCMYMKILVEVTIVEISRGEMTKEEADKVHNNLIPGNMKIEAIEGILVQSVASTSLHQLGKTTNNIGSFEIGNMSHFKNCLLKKGTK